MAICSITHLGTLQDLHNILTRGKMVVAICRITPLFMAAYCRIQYSWEVGSGNM